MKLFQTAQFSLIGPYDVSQACSNCPVLDLQNIKPSSDYVVHIKKTINCSSCHWLTNWYSILMFSLWTVCMQVNHKENLFHFVYFLECHCFAMLSDWFFSNLLFLQVWTFLFKFVLIFLRLMVALLIDFYLNVIVIAVRKYLSFHSIFYFTKVQLHVHLIVSIA